MQTHTEMQALGIWRYEGYYNIQKAHQLQVYTTHSNLKKFCILLQTVFVWYDAEGKHRLFS